MIAIIVLISHLVFFISGPKQQPTAIVIPPMPAYAPDIHIDNGDEDWELYNQEAYYEYTREFNRLFNSYRYKVAKNGRPMIARRGESYRFVKMGA